MGEDELGEELARRQQFDAKPTRVPGPFLDLDILYNELEQLRASKRKAVKAAKYWKAKAEAFRLKLEAAETPTKL